MHKPVIEDSGIDTRYSSVEPGDLADGLEFDPESEQRVRQKWQQVRCYGFKCAGFQFIAPLNIYCELLTQVKIIPLPNVPDHFLGLCNVRGNLVPVYQLECLVGQSSSSTRHALVIGQLDQAAALVIAAKPQPFDLRDFELREATAQLPEFLQTAISASYQRDDEAWYLIDHTQLFHTLANLQSNTFTSTTT